MTEADSLIAVPDIAYALSAAEGGRFGSGRDAQDTFVAHALRSEGADASEDGTGRRTPLVVSTLNSGGNNGGFRTDPGEHLVLAFSSKDSGADAGELAPTLRSMNYDESHINGGGQVAVAFEARFARNGRGAPEPIIPPLKAESGSKGDSAPLVALAGNMRHELRLTPYTNALGGGGGKPGQGYQAALTNFGVRRLTPRECERLQGFPDDWTRWDASGKEISDSARYRMLGNAVCVPVARWIGRRIHD